MRTRFMLFCMLLFVSCQFAMAETNRAYANSQYQHTVESIQKNWSSSAQAGVTASFVEVFDLNGQKMNHLKAGNTYQVEITNWAAFQAKNNFKIAAIDANGTAVGKWNQAQQAGQVAFADATVENNSALFVWEAPADLNGTVDFLYVSNQSELNVFSMVQFFDAGTPINTYPYAENFETATICNPSTTSCPVNCSSALPIDWVQGATGTDDDDDFRVIMGGVPSGSAFTGPTSGQGGTGTQYLYLESSGGCPPSTSQLLSPQFDLTGLSTPIFRYHTYLHGSDLDVNSGFVLEISNDNGMNWNVIDTQNGPEVQTDASFDWTRTDVDLSAFAGQTVSFRITGTIGTSFYGDVALDDIFVGNMPTCIEPSGFAVLAENVNSVDLDWVPSGTEGSWTIEVGAPGFMPGTGAEVSSATPASNPGSVGGLSAATDYQAYIRSNCGFTETSPWIGPLNFTTACDIFTAPFTETFDNGGSIPNCWTNEGLENWLFNNTGTGHINNLGNFLDGSDFVDVNQADGANGYFAWVDDSGNHNVGTSLVSPFINVGGLTTPGVSFWYASNNEGDINGNVDFSVDIWDGAAWNIGQFTSSMNTVDWEQVFIDLSGLSISGPIQVRFVVDENNGNGFDDDVAIDLMVVDELPTCLPPTGLMAANVLADGADISWTAEPSATSYVIEWGESPLTPGMGMTQTASATMGAITGLLPNTTYDVVVYSDCAGDPSGPTATVVSFTTLCAAFVAPYTENFDDGGMLDNCWSLDGLEPWNVSATAPTGHINLVGDFICGGDFVDNTVGDGSTGYFLWVDDSTPSSLGTNLISPLVDMSGITNPAITFYYASNDEGDANGNVDFSVDLWDGSMWIDSVFLSSENTYDWDKVVIDLAPYLPFSGNIQARFSVDEVNGGGFDDDVALDDVSFGELPTCPPVSNLAAANIAPDNFDLSWIPGGSEMEWTIEYGAPCFLPGTGAGTVETGVSTSTYNVSGLMTETDYEFYVSAVCAPGDTACIVGPIAITTPPSCPPATMFAGSLMGTDATLTWTSTATDFEIEWGVAGFTPGGGGTIVPVTGLTQSFPGLMNGTAYEFYITTICGMDMSSQVGPVTLLTPPGCGGSFFDSGGPTGNYSNFEDNVTVICPDVPGEVVTLTFTAVDIESQGGTGGEGTYPGCWDYIEIFNGADVMAPQLFGGCGTQFSNPTDPLLTLSPGDFFVSTDASGCITVRFVSDNVVTPTGWEATIVCSAPVTCTQATGLAATAMGSDVAVSWVSTETDFIVEYGLAGFMPGTGTSVNVLGATSTTIMGLMSGTEYDFYVTADCGNGDLSNPSGPASATTAPGCGDQFIDSGGIGGNYPVDVTEVTVLCPDTPGDVVSVLFTYVDIETAGGGGSDATGCWDYLEIFDGPDINAPSLGTFCGEESGDGGVPSVAGNLLSIGDSFMSTDASGCLTISFFSDTSVPETGWEADITCGPPPVCEAPTALAIMANGSDGADLSWTSMDTDFIIEYGPAGFMPGMGMGTEVPVTGMTMASISGLASGSSFDFYVRAVCGPGDESLPAGPVSLSTPPSCGDQFFDTGGAGGNYSVNQDITTTICPNIPGTVVTSAFTFVDIETTTGNGDNGAGCWDFLEIYDGPNTSSPLVGSFCGEGDGDGGTPSNPASLLVAGDEFTSSDASGCLTFRFVSDGSVSEGGWAADIICNAPPACPDAGALQVESVATDTAVISWVSTATEFVVEYGEAGFELGSGTLVTATDTSTTLDGLMEQTTYDAYVQTICSPISDIIITGAIDGPLPGGLPKAIEFYATRTVTDLDQYGFGSANNGGGTDGEEVTFPNDTIPACTFFYLSTDSASFATFFEFNAQYIDQDLGNDFAASINGDDALELFYQGTVIDVFGDINMDGSGEPWDHVDGWAYRNDEETNNDGVFDAMNWFYSGTDALDGDTLNSTATTPFPIGTFTSANGCPVGPLTFTTPCAPVLGDSLMSPIVVDLVMDTTFMGSTSSCYTDQTGNESNDVYYQVNTDPCTESISIETCGSTYDTFLRLLDASGTQIASNDDACGTQSQINDFDVVGGDTYFVVVEGFSDNNGDYTLLISPTAKNIALMADAVITPSCNGDADGEIQITVMGGAMPYTFMWSDGQTTEDITGLAAGDYTGSITDAEGCEVVSPTITVTEPAVLEVDLQNSVITNPLCNGEMNGAIDITTVGGTMPYSYMWSNGATDEDLVGIPAGSYTGSITDANGCTYVSPTITLSEPAVLEVDLASAVLADPLCNGEATGSISITTVGGTMPYTYLWSNGATDEDLTGLAAGDYTGSITDANGCEYVSPTLTLTDPALLTGTAVSVDETLPGTMDGSIDLTPAGGTGDYTYSWSNGATTEDVDMLAGGDYTVTLTDANGCEFIETYGVTTDVNNIQTLETFTIMPNPTDGQVQLTLGFAQSENIRIEIVNTLGQILYKEDMNAVNFLQREMNLDQFAAGVYFVRITASGKVATRELILAR